jgi:hypothetical protein
MSMTPLNSVLLSALVVVGSRLIYEAGLPACSRFG